MYDTIVIGTGPAGSAAAKTLSEHGYRVLLVEKCRLPRYKSCSGQLIHKAIDLVRRYFDAEIPSSVMCAPAENRGVILTDGSGREHRFEQRGWNVWRSSFDQFLAEQARACGAELRDGTTALACEERDGIVAVTLRGTEVYTEQAQYVIDCEGVAGLLKRRLLHIQPQYITTFQTYNAGSIDLDPHYFYAYLQPELSEYDAWFNVKDNQLVFGVSVKHPELVSMYHQRFLRYMTDRHQLRLEKQVKADRWLMPRVAPGCPVEHGIGRVLFAGETAGFLNPMGEGISAGLESGYHAACAIAAHFDDPALALAQYEARTEPLRAYMRRQWRMTGSLSPTFAVMKDA